MNHLVSTIAGQTTAPPWWGVPVLAGAFLIVGALLNMVQSRVAQDRSTRREDATRWIRDLRDIGAEYVAEVYALDSFSHSLWRAEAARKTDQPSPSLAGIYADLGESVKKLSKTSALFAVIAPEKLAKYCFDITKLATEAAVASATPGSDFETLSNRLKTSVGDFIQSIRAHVIVSKKAAPGARRRRGDAS